MLHGAIEAGGTKFVCAVGDRQGKILNKVTFPTEGPEKTLEQVHAFFNEYTLASIGIGSFGPIELNPQKKNYGEIGNTPKLLWKQFNIYQALVSTYQIPVFVDTDVNAAALGEFYWGAGKEVDHCLYITVGTGIGAGFVSKGETLRGSTHPEMGHIYVARHQEDRFAGSCPYHQDCLEGLASGTAIEARYGKKGNLLMECEEVWELEAYYLAQAIVNYTLILAPDRIILGGGVMKQQALLPLIRQKVSALLAKYVELESMDKYIVTPQLDDQQGIMGALALGMKADHVKGAS